MDAPVRPERKPQGGAALNDNRIISRELTDRLSAYIDANETRLVSELMELVRIPSVQSEAEPGMPFGRDCFDAVESAAQLYEENGFSVCRRGDRGYALAELGRGEKTLGLFCHCDVVSAGTGVWKQIRDPFAPEIKNGYIIGRGVGDNKGGVIATLYALKALQSAGVALKNRILVYLGGNEETGMKDIYHYVEDQPVPDAALVPDCRFPLYRGERSYSRFKLHCRTPFRRIIDFSGGNPAGVCGDATVTLPGDAQLRAELTAALQGRSNPILSENGEGQLVLRVGGGDVQRPQAVDPGHILPNLTQHPGRQICRTVDAHIHRGPAGIQIRSGNGRLRKDALQRLRRLVERKHIQ